MKKISALLLTVIILTITILPSASAVVVSTDGILHFTPGNTRWNTAVDNYAWLDNLFIRDDVNAVTLKEIVPKPEDYPYSHTFNDFVDECENYVNLYELDADTISKTYYELIDAMYYGVIALSMTSDYDTMRAYLIEYGIALDENESADDAAAVSIVYAALKNKATYILYNKEITIPKGTTLEGALVIILAGITGNYLPSGVNTITGFAVQTVKNYVSEFEQLPLSKNPDAEEIFYWLKVLTVIENGYQVPTVNYSELTQTQKAYVDNAYCSSVLEMGFEVRVDPVALLAARLNGEELAVQRLVLETMLNEAGTEYTKENSVGELFDMACENGYFTLENEFFTDVFNYEIEVAPSCEKIWFTPITIGDQLEGGDAKHLKLLLQDEEISHASTTAVNLDTTAEKETILLAIFYNDGVSVNDYAVYKFNIIKNPELEKENDAPEGDVLGQVQDLVDSLVPDGNETVTSIFAEIFPEGETTTATTAPTTTDSSVEEYLTTYATTQKDEIATSYYDFEYFQELLTDTYTTDENGNILTTSVYTTSPAETTEKTVLDTVVETVSENIELVVAPTSLVALGGLVGFFMTKKHRDTNPFEESDEAENEDE